MLVSDWSSDVCSSELATIAPAYPVLGVAGHLSPIPLTQCELMSNADKALRSEERRVGKESRSRGPRETEKTISAVFRGEIVGLPRLWPSYYSVTEPEP